MALAALFEALRRPVVRLSLVLLALMFLPGLPPSEIEHISLPFKPNRPFEGPLAVNDRLNAAQILTRVHHLSSNVKLRYFKVSARTKICSFGAMSDTFFSPFPHRVPSLLHFETGTSTPAS